MIENASPQGWVKILIKPNVTTLFDPCQTFWRCMQNMQKNGWVYATHFFTNSKPCPGLEAGPKVRCPGDLIEELGVHQWMILLYWGEIMYQVLPAISPNCLQWLDEPTQNQVSKGQKNFFWSSIPPKKERFFFSISALDSKSGRIQLVQFFCSFSISFFQICLNI